MNTQHEQRDFNSPAEISRRRFLEAAGFSLSLAAFGGCGRAPVQTALPLISQPEGLVPGRMLSYASTCAGCPAGCGMLVGVRDGRPLKMEGMPEHPLSAGGLCAVGQALPMGLYDGQRLKQPLSGGEPASWNDVDQAIANKLQTVKDNGGAVRVVTPTITSPTLQATINTFLAGFGDGKHVTVDAVSSSAILDAHEKTHGGRVLPCYQFENARVIVSLGADFLGTWISPVEFTAAWRSRRVPTQQRPEMSYHAHFEGRMSLTGGKADRRYRVAPDEYSAILNHLAKAIAELSGQSPPHGVAGESPLDDAIIGDLADRLWEARGESLVVSDSQDVAVQMLVNWINDTLENYGQTLDIARPSRQRQGNDAEVLGFVDELKAGQVGALLVLGTDLTHNLPDRDALAEAIGNVSLVVSFAEREDDFASLAHFVCPDHHPLESWSDAEPVDGIVSLIQPTISPLHDTRSALESFSKWSGQDKSAYDILQASWKKNILSRTAAQPFQSFWDQAVHDGFVEVEPRLAAVGEFNADVVKLVESPRGEGTLLALYSKIGLTDSRHAHNPWLQELPDPVTKATWDNYVCVSPHYADELGVVDGDVVKIEAGDASVELPVLVQPGQHDRVIAIALGYGVRGTDRFANVGPQWFEARPTVLPGELVGKNVAAFIDAAEGSLRYNRSGVSVTTTSEHRDLARTQAYHHLEVPERVAPHGAEVRHAVEQTTLPAFKQNPQAGKPDVHHFGETQLWAEDHPKTGHWWGMAIDLNACTGCSACLIACQSENNVPVVGKDEIRRQREMHWIRIDRYYAGEDDDIEVLHQPMMCQHCDNAPCETVCPVLATIHGEEGLNQQAYNRCVGTRYCANNCPYKVRRFNWFNYPHEDPLENLVFNPDVSVRTRGVMEKCSMCVQRIHDGKNEAKRLGLPLADGDIQTACQQSCPAQAIIFGDMNDENSEMHASLGDPRSYRVLEEFNFRTSIGYKRVVKNREEQQEQAPHSAAGDQHSAAKVES